MTSAESANADRTLEEFDASIRAAIHDGTDAGISIFAVVMRLLHYIEGVTLEPEQLQLVARRLIKLGTHAAMDAGLPAIGLFPASTFVEHVARQAIAEWQQPGSDTASPSSNASGSPADAAETAPGSRDP